jgi:hypothetical protein
VEEGNPTVNAGTSPDLEVVSETGQSFESYIRFTVSGVSGPIQSVRLRVYSTTDNVEDGPRLYAADNAWTETEINWSNRPSRGSEVGNQGLVRRYSWTEYDVTPVIQGDGTYSFVLAGETNERVRFAARESSNGPQLVITLASVTATSEVPAATASAAAKEGNRLTFATEADAHVVQGSPAENHGTSPELQANGEAGAAQIPYLRFVVGGITGSNQRVTLRVFVTQGASDGLPVRFAESDWSETGEEGLTWESQPTLLSGPVANPGAITAGSWVEYDVSAVVTADGIYTFALVADGNDNVSFSSREGSEPPQLVVTLGSSLATTPTPTAAISSNSAASGEVVLVGAGDIATCNREQDEMTAQLLDNIPGTVFTVGDNAYVDGSYTEYLNCYEPSWGRHKSRTKPIPGNHEYNTTGAAGYFQYFNNVPSYYAYDLGAWRIYALNSEIDVSLSSPQVAWLVEDLAANPKQCVLAYWHKPRWSSGTNNGSEPSLQELWDLLYKAGAELVVAGHEHNYERFAEMDGSGAKVAEGLREIVVGTGGAGLYDFGAPLTASEVRDSSTFGVLKLTLHETGYDWEFVPVPNSTFTDSGSSNCH